MAPPRWVGLALVLLAAMCGLAACDDGNRRRLWGSLEFHSSAKRLDETPSGNATASGPSHASDALADDGVPDWGPGLGVR